LASCQLAKTRRRHNRRYREEAAAAGTVVEDGDVTGVGVNCWGVKRKGRYVTRNPPATSVGDSRIQNLRILIGRSSRSRADRRG
jgi:hypothetical protein